MTGSPRRWKPSPGIFDEAEEYVNIGSLALGRPFEQMISRPRGNGLTAIRLQLTCHEPLPWLCMNGRGFARWMESPCRPIPSVPPVILHPVGEAPFREGNFLLSRWHVGIESSESHLRDGIKRRHFLVFCAVTTMPCSLLFRAATIFPVRIILLKNNVNTYDKSG